MHRLVHNLSVQTLILSTPGKIFNRRHFEIFFSFFQENMICISHKLSPLHEMSNPVFLLIIKKKTTTNLLSAELTKRAHFEDAFPLMLSLYMRLFYLLNKLLSWFCISNYEILKTHKTTRTLHMETKVLK